MKSHFVLSLFAAGALVGCTTYSGVRERQPPFKPATHGAGKVSGTEAEMQHAQRIRSTRPLTALGIYLATAENAARQLKRNPSDKDALHNYNFAVGRTLAIIRDAKLNPWSQTLRVPLPGGDYCLTYRPDPRPQWNPALYTFTPADQFDIHGTYVKDRVARDGLGAPLVAVGRSLVKDAEANFSLPRVYYGVTANLQFEGRRCVLRCEDPLATETTRMDGRTYPLAANFTVPLAVMLASTDPKKLELTRLLNPAKYAQTARIARLQPYDPNKTVVLVVHGLMDSPATWAPMINQLRGDKSIRQHYQFWFYSYPSGYPYPYSAAILRRQLAAVHKKYPSLKPMVVIGHSMGGCISRLLITDAGDKLWMTLFKKKPAQVNVPSETKKLISESIIFQHEPKVGRVIFICAPLRGSDMASNWLGRLGSSLVKSPITLLKAGNDLLKLTTFQGNDLKMKRIPNSVDTLAPNNRFVKAINTIPVTSGIPYYTIIGDRGKGDSPNSSDGVVPYWSSHMDGAKSECIVPSSHPAHQNPQAIEEVRRILNSH